MKKEDLFLNVDDKFWRHIHTESVLPIFPSKDKREILMNLGEEIVNGHYFPRTPRSYLTLPKNTSCVPRICPIFEIEDYSVYYYCIKVLQEHLVVNKQPNTFGAFRLDSVYRATERGTIFHEDYSPVACFSRFLWIKEWTEYMNLSNQIISNYFSPFIIEFDIANFYDKIDLFRLEKKVRTATLDENEFEVNLLFHFLKNWDRKNLSYNQVSIGIPQDEVGECSRILANFYLQDFDKKIIELSKNNGVTFLRYADDMLLVGEMDNEAKMKELLFTAGILLNKEGLSINSSKTKSYYQKDYLKYRAYDIFEMIGDGKNVTGLSLGVSEYKKRKEEKCNFRQDSVIKRILNAKSFLELTLADKDYILGEAKEIFYFLDIRLINKIISLIGDEGKRDYIDFVEKIMKDVPFNQISYGYRKYISGHYPETLSIEQVDEIISEKNTFL